MLILVVKTSKIQLEPIEVEVYKKRRQAYLILMPQAELSSHSNSNWSTIVHKRDWDTQV